MIQKYSSAADELLSVSVPGALLERQNDLTFRTHWDLLAAHRRGIKPGESESCHNRAVGKEIESATRNYLTRKQGLKKRVKTKKLPDQSVFTLKEGFQGHS